MDAKSLEVLRKLKESIAAADSDRSAKKADPQDSARWLLAELKSAFEHRRKKKPPAKRSAARKPTTAKAETPKRTKPKTPWPDEPPPSGQKDKRKDREPAIWISKACRFCKAEFTANLNWSPQPIMCPRCRKERKARTGRSSKAGGTMYTSIQVFSGGGGPGSGKRR